MQSSQLASAEAYFPDLQNRLCDALSLDNIAFDRDPWQRPQGGGGCTCTLSDQVFEQIGIGYSLVEGTQLPPSASAHRPQLAGARWRAMGVSLVAHPHNPHIPTSHMNVRMFTAFPEHGDPVWWFGGGFDLTPYYGYEEDCQHWHRCAHASLAPFGQDLYPRFKNACDEYFYIKHRDECRGIGGLFFDDFDELGFDQSLAMTQAVGDAFLTAYLPLVERRRDTPYDEAQRAFQQYRRGRYVEFNLVYDRGTLFGLQSGGRTESILMSLPPSVRFGYRWEAEPGSREARLQEDFLRPRDWI